MFFYLIKLQKMEKMKFLVTLVHGLEIACDVVPHINTPICISFVFFGELQT